ncbi:hypothetical protein [Clostridium sp. DJ247]|uniref:hypothetical protein n=1 Tax=Clostridium sp. DJ247 TaxID=2726188 RepID=UPI001625BC09|nr:hypothetical protein [Clostridium sp. DJ247]MBC2582786.1 hypothetical protein [Clostridium sp. DJ247]
MIKANEKKIMALTISLVLASGGMFFTQNSSVSAEDYQSNNTIEQKDEKKVHKGDSFAKLLSKLGLTAEDIKNAQNSGKTLFDLAKEKGYTPNQVRSMLIEIKTEAINKAVTDGKLTKDQGTTAIKEMKDKISKWDGSMKHHCKKHWWSKALNQLGITDEEIAEAKKSGKNIFDLAKEKKGLTPEQVKSSIIKTNTDTINKKVSEGKITREKGDLIISKMKAKVENWDGTFKELKKS